MRRSVAVVTAALALAAGAFAAAGGEVACTECGEPGLPGAKYCMKCGAELVPPEEPQVKFCPYCGAENAPEAVYCSSCDKRFPEVKGKYTFCPHCGEAVGAGDTTCRHCGETIAVPEISHTRGAWGPSNYAATLDFSGWFGEKRCGSWGAEMAVFFSEHVSGGVKINRVFHADGSGFLLGWDMRAYFLPYCRGFFLKPYGKGELGMERHTWASGECDGLYYRLCGGVDFRIVRSFVVPYFDAGLQHSNRRYGGSYFVICGGLRAVF